MVKLFSGIKRYIVEQVVPWARPKIDLCKDLRISRALLRYSRARGNTLAGGVAYYCIFSLASALTVGFTVLLKVIDTDTAMSEAVFQTINRFIPGLVSWPGHPGLVDPVDLVDHIALNATSVIAGLALLYSASKVMGTLKKSIRAMFGIAVVPDNFVFEKLRNLLGFIFISLGIVTTSALGIFNSALRETLLDWLDINTTLLSGLMSVFALLVNATIDSLIMLLLLRVISRIRVPRKDLLLGLTLFTIFSAIIRAIGTSIPHVSHNIILASAATLATILIWMSIITRIILVTCAYIANPPWVDRKLSVPEMHANETPNYVTLSDPKTLSWELPRS